MSKSEDRMVRTFGALVVGLIAGSGVMWLSFRDEIKFAEKFSLLKSCDELITERKVEMPDAAYEESVVNGYISGLDKYSFYRGGAARKLIETADLVNALPTPLGSGFTISFNENGVMYFEEVVSGMPADKQGIREGDIVQSVDGKSVIGSDKKSAFSIAGKDGTSCKLVLLRGGETIELEFVRSNSTEKEWYDVDYKMYGESLYIKIPTFKTNEKLSMLETEKYSSVIVDLRDNSGGYTDNALDCAADFIADGYMKYYYFNGEVETLNVNNGKKLGVPIIVLVNEKTASAAEIMTSLFKQYGDATIIGVNTKGKGCFQSNVPLGDGKLRYTDGYFTVGRWECWHGVGIAPDVEVQMDSELIGTPEDVQLEKALEIADNMH